MNIQASKTRLIDLNKSLKTEMYGQKKDRLFSLSFKEWFGETRTRIRNGMHRLLLERLM